MTESALPVRVLQPKLARLQHNTACCSLHKFVSCSLLYEEEEQEHRASQGPGLSDVCGALAQPPCSVALLAWNVHLPILGGIVQLYFKPHAALWGSTLWVQAVAAAMRGYQAYAVRRVRCRGTFLSSATAIAANLARART